MPDAPPKSERQLILEAAVGVIKKQGLKSELIGSKKFSEYFFKGVMLFNVLGDGCTRNCRFCVIKYKKKPDKPSLDEGKRIAAVSQKLGLRYIVLSPVARDDLADGGASYLASYIRDIKKINPNVKVETFIPDYGKKHLIKMVVDAEPDVISYSLDTIKRLYSVVKGSEFDFERSIRTVRTIRELSKDIPIRATIMVGFRESWFEVIGALRRLRKAGVDMITISQYYRPTKNHIQVLEYVPVERFELYEREAYQLGYKHVKIQSGKPIEYSDYILPEFISSVQRKPLGPFRKEHQF
ncbi:MAG: lipoyl synthase [Candidatus Bilamarchaeaceae archaeon]